jgi:hypothetical protein
MSFTQQRDKLSSQINKVNSVEEYQKAYLSTPVIDWLSQLTGKYIYHLYDDLRGAETRKDLSKFLDDFYEVSDEHAKNCITIVLKAEHLQGPKIKDWTNSSLPAFDNFLLKLINVVLGEPIKKQRDKIYETDAYEHLIDKGGQYEKIGQAFKSIYQTRNNMLHVQVEDDQGIRKQIRWGSNKYRKAKELILLQFKTALDALDQLIN